jgi:fructose-1,6-bisphosphatase/inositol monophosphatase family enzyme
MDLNNEQLLNLCQIAKTAALKAGEIISSKQDSDIAVQSKEGGENIASCVVTQIDLDAQEAILDVLTPTLNKYDLGLLTEESTDDNSRFSKEYFWCIDPLDGTLAFSRGEDGYSTSIALISKDGVPIIGVVYNPRTNSLYHAIKGHGALKNDLPLKVRESSKDLTLLFDQSYLKYPAYKEHIEKLKTDLKDLGLNELKIHPLGGAVMNGISTIEMAPAFYYKFPKKALGGGSLWDFAASSVIQSEAGGYNCDYHQQPLDLNRPDSTFMNHNGVIYCSSKNLLEVIPKITKEI